MLSPENRLRDPELFRKAFRYGSHAGNSKLVVHALTGEVSETDRLVGFVVPKKVFSRATDRNRIKRQLRHLMREYVEQLPPSCVLVIRVLPGSKGATYAQLADALENGINRVLKKVR
ncbi:MAG TPA: ribonuclease P protein component [Actinomyces sp.]|nr:ribonuclease P protein component [Acidobacteriota bacterium]HHT40450.1 ribonuclease P protein component [Actinomyces sp.]